LSESSGNALIDLISMSILNNLIHVTSMLSEIEESKGYSGLLILFIVTVRNHEAYDAMLGPLKSSFLASAFAMLSPCTEIACAAA
jgi:hypothetical protein